MLRLQVPRVMTPKIGLPLGAVFTIVLSLAVFSLWTWFSAEKRKSARERRRRPGAKGAVFAGLLAASLSLAGSFLRETGGEGRSFWLYVAFWLVFAVVPFLIGLSFLVRWARRTHPQEWQAV